MNYSKYLYFNMCLDGCPYWVWQLNGWTWIFLLTDFWRPWIQKMYLAIFQCWITLEKGPISVIDLLSSVQAEREIQKGPHENLQGFLDAVDRLRSIERFFSSNRSYRSSDGVLNHVNALLSKALVKMEDEFQKQLTQRRLCLIISLNVFNPNII